MPKYSTASNIAFTTKRLEAQFLTAANQQFVIDLYNQKESGQFLEGVDVMKDIELVMQCYKDNNNIGAYLIFCKETKKFIGFGGVQNQEFLSDGSLALADKIEFLIMVDSKQGGLGYGYEFSEAFLKFFLEKFPDQTLAARVNKENSACLKLLSKVGFIQKGEVCYRDRGNKFCLLRAGSNLL